MSIKKRNIYEYSSPVPDTELGIITVPEQDGEHQRPGNHPIPFPEVPYDI
jgi:hypothetical protein